MSFTLSSLRSNLYPQFHAVGESDLVFTDNSQINSLLEDRLKDLAMEHQIFVQRDASFVTLVAGQALYSLPARHLATAHVALNNRPLVASSRTTLERQDTEYRTRAATVAKPVGFWYEDRHGFNQIGLFPVPAAADAGSKLDIIYFEFLCDLSGTIALPKIIGDMLEQLVIADLLSMESDFQMIEVAQSARALYGLMREPLMTLRGASQ
jgi:hypothetical protein